MKNLELSIEREIEFMIKHQLTADELFLLKLIFFAQDGHPELISQFFSQNSLTKDLKDLLTDLQNKNVINKSYEIPNKGDIFNPLDVDINKNVIKSFLQHSQELGLELFEAYPVSTVINGRVFSLRNVTKLYRDLDELSWAYGKAIKFDPIKHQKVLELLEYAKDNNLINSGICDYIASHRWEDIEQLKDSGVGTLDTMEVL